ncbi:MAG: hypothetical protein AAF806_12465 [Bacteroidota bacterium]
MNHIIQTKQLEYRNGKYYYRGKCWTPNQPVKLGKNKANKWGEVLAVVGDQARLVRFGSNQHEQNRNYVRWKSYWSRFNGHRRDQIKAHGKYYALRPLFWSDAVLWSPKSRHTTAIKDKAFLRKVDSYQLFTRKFGVL